MKKLLTLAIISIFSISCTNSTIDNEESTQDQKNSTTISRAETETISLERALSATEQDLNLVSYNLETHQIIYSGRILQGTPEIVLDATIQDAENFFETGVYLEDYTTYGDVKTKTLCSTTTSTGVKVSIVKVYRDHYVGYEFVTKFPDGITVSSSMGAFAPFECATLWMLRWQ